ncbi:MAG: alanyl-tRNA editing protein AlaXM [Candidatus Anstonellales archaeon]
MEALYLEDSYLKECDAKVESVKDGKYVVLNRTIFYPNGGGQPHDTGKIIRKSDGKEFRVVFVGKFEGKISHEVDGEGLKEGEEVKCILDWDRRYKLMRMHTAAHVLAGGVLYKKYNAKITGNQLDVDKSRFDFNLENFDRETFERAVAEANEILGKNIEVKTYYMPRAEAMKNPEMVKLAGALPPNIDPLRIVEIAGVDIQADGGTHVKNLKEVGKIRIIKLENKGKDNRRVYFELV